MAEKILTIDSGKFSKSYNLKGVTNIKITGLNGADFFGYVSVANTTRNTVVLTLNNGQKIQFTNCDNLQNIKLTTDTGNNEYAAGDFFNTLAMYFQPIENPTKGTTVNGSVFDDTIDVKNYTVQTTGKNAYKGLIINGGNGDDAITGTSGNDTITGGTGENEINYSDVTFGDDTVKLTKGEILHINGLVNPSFSKHPKNGNDLLVSSEYGTITIKNYYSKDTGATVTINDVDISKTRSLGEINAANFFDENPNKPQTTYNGTALADEVNASGVAQKYDKKHNPLSTGVKINTGLGDDKVTGSNFNDTINTGDGDDTIISTSGNDTITGGSGTNTIVYSSVFDTDTVNLTKGENLIIDLTSYGYTVNDLKGKVKVLGKDMEITLPKDNKTNYGTLIIKNFGGSNVVGSGSVKLLLKKESELNAGDEVVVNLNEDEVLEYTNIDFNAKGQFTGSRFSETITADGLGRGAAITTGTGINTVNLLNATGNNTITGGADKDIVNLNNSSTTTVKAGDGLNEINISGTGNNTIITGKNNDEFSFVDTSSSNIIKAGAGENIIRIDTTSDFGTIQLTEEKVCAKNTIVFSTDLTNEWEIVKNNNDLIITKQNGENLSSLTIKDYYAVRPAKNNKYAEICFKTGDNPKELSELLTMTGKQIAIGGSGTINGTPEDNTIYGSDGKDTIYANGGHDLIYAQGGNDIIHGETGTHTIYGGDGNDKIYGGDSNYLNGAERVVNKIYGGNGNDEIYAGKDSYTEIYGGDGNDKIYDNEGGFNQIINGGTGNDTITLTGNSTTVVLNANCGNDTIVCATATNIMFSDIVSPEQLANEISITKDNDNYTVLYGTNQITLQNVNPYGLKFITSDESKITLTDWLEDHPIISVINGSGYINGTNNDDIITGSAKGDVIYGQDGNDTINGMAGDDNIYGGDGNDIINAGSGNNNIEFHETYGNKHYNDTVLNGGGKDTLKIYGELKNLRQKENDLVISYGKSGDTITVKDYYTAPANHSVKKIESYDANWNYIGTYTIEQAIESLQGGLVNTDNYEIMVRGEKAEVRFDEELGVSVPNSGTNYIYASDNGSNINAENSQGENYLIGGRGDDVLTGGSGTDYFAGGGGHNEIHITSGGGQDFLSVAAADEDNVIIFNNITFTKDNSGKITNLGNMILTDTLNGSQTRNVYIKGYGTSDDYLTAREYYNTGDAQDSFYYEGYTLQDKNGNKISLADAIKMSINREGDTDWTVGDLNGNSTNETFYTNSTDEAQKIVTATTIYNGSVDAGAGNDTIYSGGIYQSASNGTIKPYIWAGEGDDEIHAEGGKIYFTTSRTDLQYSDTDLIAVNTKQTNGNTTTTTVYNADHIYITPDKKVMTGYFFFAYQLGKDDSGNTTFESIMLDESDKYEYMGAYDDDGTNLHIYHTNELVNAKIEGKKTYFFDYGDKVASGQVDVYGAEGDDRIFIGNGSSAYGGDGNDTIIGDGIAYGENGNDKIIFNNDNHYIDGLGFTYYYADGGKGNDYVNMENVIKREHNAVELTSETVEYENEYDTQFMFSEGINTLVINPQDDKNIIINMSQFAWNEQNRHERWYDHGHKNSDVAFGTFQRGDDLYIAMNNGQSKNGTLIIKDYFAYEKDPNEQDGIKKDIYGDPVRVYSSDRRANLKIYFYSTIREADDYFFPESYMTIDEFIGHYNDWKDATDENGDGHKDTLKNGEEFNAYYAHRIDEINSGTGYVGRWTTETNNYFTFIDNQGENGGIEDVINPDKETPEFYEHGTEAVVEDPNNPTSVTYNTVNVYHNSGYYIIGGDGNQTINGGEGDDVIYGDNIGHHDENGNWVEVQNGGNDRIYAGAGDDFVVGGKGDDFIDGGDGQNELYGGEGDDTLIAGSPVNTTVSQYGDASRGIGSSYAYGEEGNDTIYAQAVLNNDGTINEEASNTYLAEGTGEGTQYLYGGDGNDTIIANSYRQKVYAGAGDDTVKFYNNNNSQMEISHFSYNENQIYLGEGNDKFYAYGNGGYGVSADSGDNIIDARGSSAVAFIQGGTGTDTIYGGSGKEYINTGLGNSTVYAGDGDDVIYSGTGEYYSAKDMHKSDEVHGGAGNDTIELFGKSKAFGDEGDDIISLDGGRQNVPSALTIDGGEGNDIYRGSATSGVNTIVASEGNDKIQFFNVSAKCFKAFRKGDDFIIQKTDTTSSNVGLTVLKDYYKDNQQELFNNWTVETYSDDQRGPQRGKYTLAEFIDYISGGINIIPDGEGTPENDYMEAADTVTDIDGKAGNDNIIAGQRAKIINGGAGDDYIIGSQTYEEYQIIAGDSGSVSLTQNQDMWGNPTNTYTVNYQQGPNSETDGNDNIISYANQSYIFGEGGNDTISVENGTAHIWGGDGNDKITTGYNGIDYGYAEEIHGEGGDDYIKARAGFIDGGTGDDTIIQKSYGMSHNTILQILKDKYGATNEWINKLYNDENSISRKSYQVGQAYEKGIADTQNKIREYKYAIQYCETNGVDWYGSTSLNEWKRKLADTEAGYNGLKKTYEDLEQAVTAAYNADVTANNDKSLNGIKGSKDLYIDAMLSTTSTEEEKAAAKETYEHDKLVVKTYKEFVDNYDKLTYSGWDYVNGTNYNFRAEGDKAYWGNKLTEAELLLDGVTGTKTAYDNLYATREYANYNSEQTRLNNYQTYLDILNNGGTSANYTGPAYTDIHIDSWFNRAELLSDNILGCFGTRNTYELIKSYVENYDNNEWQPDNYTSPVDEQTAEPLYTNFREEGDKAYWQNKMQQAKEVYENDLYLYNLYSTYAEFYFDEEFNDPNYAVHTLIKLNDGTTPAYVSFRQEAEENYSGYYEGTPSGYWSRLANLISNRINGTRGTQAITDEMYMRYSGGGLPYSSYKMWAEENDRNINEYNEYKDFYENYNTPTAEILIKYSGYIGHYTAENLNGYIPEIQSSIDGSGATYLRLKSELDAMVADYIENAPGLTEHDKQIALRIMTHNQNDIILGGDGNDTITIGHTDEGEYASTSSVIAMGEEGNDTYIIEGGYADGYSTYNNPRIEIYDTEGTNTIKFNNENFKSGNIGMYANIELVKDEDGNLVKDENGNYRYELKNFGPSYTESGSSTNNVAYNLDRTPLYNGDAGYAIVFVDNESFKDTGNQFNYGGLSNSSQEGVKFDVDTLNHLDYIWSKDGKYITKAQIQAAMQNTANWLAEHGYDSFMNALDRSDDLNQRPQILNNLRNFENLGSLEWITPTGENGTPTNNDIIVPVTEGLTGTDANDTLVINSAPELVDGELNNVIDLKQGNDKVTFEGAFGNYIIKSSSTADNVGVARQSDIISLAGYSVKDGTLKFSQEGSNLVLTAYADADDPDSAVGTITYKDFLGSEYSLRSFVLKADDHDYLVSKETALLQKNDGSNATSLRIDDDNNSYYNIRFVESTDGSKVILDTNGKRAYYYILGDTPLSLGWVKDGEPVEVFSQGDTNDRYNQGLTSDINLTIHDAGGSNELDIANASWDGKGAVTDSKFRLFFDIDTEGNVSQTKHIVWQERFRTYETVLKKYGDGNDAYYREEKVYYYDTDNLLKLLNNDSEHMAGVVSFDGNLKRIQTDDRRDHSERLVYEENVDASVLPKKYIRSIATDVVPWLKENNYESVSDALTKLKADILAKQALMETVDVDSEEFTDYSNSIKADNAKIDELFGYFDIGYGDALYNNLYGTDGDDTLSGSYSYTTSRIIGGKGDDTIDLYNANTASIVYNYDPVNGDGHDVVIENLYTQSHNQIIVDRGENTMFTKFRADGWNLKIEFYSNSESSENPDGSITLQNYFKNKYDYRTDVLIVKSGDEVEHNYSIKALMPENLINDNVFFSTPASDNFAETGSDRVIYIANSDYNTNDTIANSSKNDEIYISQNNSYTDIRYTVGQGGDDVIYGSFYATGLIVDYADTHAQTEYRQIGEDMKMIFFMGDGEAKHKVGSITFKDYYAYNSSKIGNALSDEYDRFIFRTGTGENVIDTRVNSVTLLENYRLLGGSLEDNNDAPYFNETIAVENAVIPSDAVQNTIVFNDVESFRDLSFAINGNDLVITHNGKTTTIADYTAGTAKITHIRVGDIVKDLNDNKSIQSIALNIPIINEAEEYNEVAAAVGTINGTGNADMIEVQNNFNGVENIKSNGGNDKIIVNNNNINIDAGWGDDTVNVTGRDNVIRGSRGNDIINVTAGSGETNTIIFDDNTYGEWGGSSYCGDDIINARGGNLKLIFSDQWITDVKLARVDNYLAIRYNNCNNTIFIKDYFLNDAKNPEVSNIILVSHKNNAELSVEDMITQNYSSATGLYEAWGTDGDDKFIHANLGNQSVTYNFKKGNDTLEFVNISESNKDNINRYAEVNSDAETDKYGNVLNKDTLVMGGYHDGSSGYANKHRYGLGDDGAITVTAIHDKTYNSHKKIVTEVTYNDFLNKDTDGNWKSADIQVTDFGNDEQPYQIKRYDSIQTIDTYKSYSNDITNAYENVEAIFIKAGAGTSNITDTTSYVTKSIITDGGANLNYTSSDGGDIILTNSAVSNDTYNIGGFSETTYIKDNGGNDILNLTNLRYNAEMDAQYPTYGYNDLKYLYLAFNTDKYGNTDDTFVLTKTSSSSNQIWRAGEYLGGKIDFADTNYSLIIDAARTATQISGNELGIETVSAATEVVTGYNDSGYAIYEKQEICKIDINSWYSTVKGEVVAWLNDNGYDSTAQVFGLNTSNNANNQTVEALCAIYDKYTANDFKALV